LHPLDIIEMNSGETEVEVAFEVKFSRPVTNEEISKLWGPDREDPTLQRAIMGKLHQKGWVQPDLETTRVALRPSWMAHPDDASIWRFSFIKSDPSDGLPLEKPPFEPELH